MRNIKKYPLILLFTISAFADFTVVSLPDIQNMTWSPVDQNLYDEMQYIIDNKDALNVQMVASLGDYTAGGYGSTSAHGQWQVARNSVNMLLDANIPYAVCMGNHDMDLVPDYNIPQKMDRFVQYFPVADFEGYPYFGGYFRNMSNSYYLFNADGMDFIVLSLQNFQESLYDPAVADWANGVLDTYSDHRAIIITHMLNAGNEYMTNIIEQHDNVFMTNYGHDCADTGERYWTSSTPSGNTIHNIMSDYQCRGDEGGGAVLRWYTFKTEENKVEAYTYSTYRKQFETDANSQFSFDYEMAISPIPSITSVTQSPDLPEEYGDVTISAKLKDDVGIETATILWGKSESAVSNRVTMSVDGDIYSGAIPGQILGTTIYYKVEVTDADANKVTSDLAQYTIEQLVYSWNSYDVIVLSGSPQAEVGTGELKASIELYESINDNGVTKGELFTEYNSTTHPEGFNNVSGFWYGSLDDYPYAGKNADARTVSDPSPVGVYDLQIHPPENNHLTVCAFKAPVNGSYKVSGLGIRRIASESGSVAVVLKNSSTETIAEVTATSQNWSTDTKMYDLGILNAGDMIYFGVDNVELFNFDAAEVSWTINLFSVADDVIIPESSAGNTESSSEATSSTGVEPVSGSDALSQPSDVESSETGESNSSNSSNYSSDDSVTDIHQSFGDLNDIFHYTAQNKSLRFYDPSKIKRVYVTGLDGRVKTVYRSFYHDTLEFTSLGSGILLLRIETTDNRVVTHTIVSY